MKIKTHTLPRCGFKPALIFALASLASLAAFAAEHEEAAEAGIPRVVLWQAVNFVLFAAILYFLLRKKIVEYYRTREESFRQALLKAESARRDAETQKLQVQQRLEKLQTSQAETLRNARSEAEALKQKIIAEAKDLATNMQAEAKRTADAEVQKALSSLREELLTQSIAAAKELLSKQMNEPDQKRLQNEFVEKIQVVRP